MDKPQNLRKDKFPFPQRDILTANQIANLVQIGSFAVHSMIAGAHTEPTQKIELDGGCKASAEALFMKVCDKLDGLLNDAERWDFSLQNTLEAKLEAMYDQNLKFLEEQTKSAREVNTPHFYYKPILARFHTPDNSEAGWIAYIGHHPEDDDAMVGIGPTPRDAIESFDSLFTGEALSDGLTQWLADREAKLAAKKDTNAKSVDDERTGASRKAKERGKKLPRNRGEAGTEPEIGGA
jgi:hypothetical protein